ncbi:MAG: PhzF family phenazine biosynthesis protein [candidate division WOR-3 bacterium]
MTTHRFIMLGVFARHQFEGNQLSVFSDSGGLSESEMQTMGRENRFSETLFIIASQPNERGWPRRSSQREVPIAGQQTLDTAFVI